MEPDARTPTTAKLASNLADSPHKPSGILARITLQMTASLCLDEVLTTITQGLVEEFDAALARIWLLGPGDLCAVCHKADACLNRTQCLHIKASAGLYTNLDGEYRRIPLGALKIGRIAQGWGPTCTNDVMGDERLPNKSWLQEHRLQAFAGYPLLFQEELLGVVALFSRRSLSPEEFERLAVFANQAAIAIKNAQLFAEVEQLKNRLQAENVYLREEIRLAHNFEDILGRSEALKQVLHKVEQVASTDATVLILGETGTGKELFARAVHNLSPRRNRTLVKVNCAALPAHLIESELFGHEKGAFTGAVARRSGRFELAHGGTIFLDEIGDLPLESQVKLLRVLQEGEFERLGSSRTTQVDVRVIAATNRDLKQAMASGDFRQDLYYRLHVFPLTLPALRECPDDIPLLVRHFTATYAAKLGKTIETIPQRVMAALQAYTWPGNVRELEHLIERAVILSPHTTLELDEPFDLLPRSNDGARAMRTLQEVERQHILSVLDETTWQIEGPRGAAVRLGLNPSTLRSRMRKSGIGKP
ncbi:MAG: sigma 54-interacting transcriptional regulator [bacterium]|nr:sigma 54-interacting transcriptional regulator [bacterium]